MECKSNNPLNANSELGPNLTHVCVSFKISQENYLKPLDGVHNVLSTIQRKNVAKMFRCIFWLYCTFNTEAL